MLRAGPFPPAVRAGRDTERKSGMARGPGSDSPVNVTHHLKGIEFPAERDDLVEQAKSNGAPSDVMEAIEAMPEQT